MGTEASTTERSPLGPIKVMPNSNATPKSLLICTLTVGGVFLNSTIAQLLLSQNGHPTSLLRFVIWALVYVAVVFGLLRKIRLAYWFGLLIAVLQIVPLVLLATKSSEDLFGKPMPSWYPISLIVSAILGAVILIALLARGSRDFFRATGSDEADIKALA